MSDIRDASVRVSCEQALARFLVSIDRGQATAGLDQFAPDAVLDLGGVVSCGTSELEATLSKREHSTTRATLHVVSAFDLERTAPEQAVGRGGLVIYAGAPDRLNLVPEALARFATEFRCLDGSWIIAGHRVSICGSGSAA